MEARLDISPQEILYKIGRLTSGRDLCDPIHVAANERYGVLKKSLDSTYRARESELALPAARRPRCTSRENINRKCRRVAEHFQPVAVSHSCTESRRPPALTMRAEKRRKYDNHQHEQSHHDDARCGNAAAGDPTRGRNGHRAG